MSLNPQVSAPHHTGLVCVLACVHTSLLWPLPLSQQDPDDQWCLPQVLFTLGRWYILVNILHFSAVSSLYAWLKFLLTPSYLLSLIFLGESLFSLSLCSSLVKLYWETIMTKGSMFIFRHLLHCCCIPHSWFCHLHHSCSWCKAWGLCCIQCDLYVHCSAISHLNQVRL